MPEQTYPTPKQALAGSGGLTGPPYLKYLKVAKDWAAITTISRFEDGGIDSNQHAVNTVQEYRLSYDGLTDEEAVILDNFWDAHRLSVTFTFVEPRDHPWTEIEGDTVTGCRFISYEKDHDNVKSTQRREVVIGKYPV